jgi:hypothetical protein
LLSAIAPVAVGIALAFTWNAAVSHAPGAAGPGSTVTPEVEMTVEQAAAQVWASASLPPVAARAEEAGPGFRHGPLAPGPSGSPASLRDGSGG